MINKNFFNLLITKPKIKMKNTTIPRKISIFIAIITSFIIVACGGSSGGGTTTTTPISTLTPENFVVTPELTELDEAI